MYNMNWKTERIKWREWSKERKKNTHTVLLFSLSLVHKHRNPKKANERTRMKKEKKSYSLNQNILRKLKWPQNFVDFDRNEKYFLAIWNAINLCCARAIFRGLGVYHFIYMNLCMKKKPSNKLYDCKNATHRTKPNQKPNQARNQQKWEKKHTKEKKIMLR